MKRLDGVLLRTDVPDREDVSELRAHFEPGLVVLVHWRCFGAAEMRGAMFVLTDETLEKLVQEARRRAA